MAGAGASVMLSSRKEADLVDAADAISGKVQHVVANAGDPDAAGWKEITGIASQHPARPILNRMDRLSRTHPPARDFPIRTGTNPFLALERAAQRPASRRRSAPGQ